LLAEPNQSMCSSASLMIAALPGANNLRGPQEQIEKAISMGISKVNVNTEFQLSFAKATREYIEAGKDLEGKGFDPRKLLAPGKAAIIKDH
jgi:fructose/tagatose bisphosphate aldolase